MMFEWSQASAPLQPGLTNVGLPALLSLLHDMSGDSRSGLQELIYAVLLIKFNTLVIT
nr:hypothetical protein [Chlamydiota bacterium]